METYTVTILEPKAKKLLDDLESLNLIKLQKDEKPKKKKRQFGSMKGLVIHIADDFDAPLAEQNKDISEIEKRDFYLSAPVMSDEERENYKEVKEWMNQWRKI